jgi:hypothetical protein
MKSIIATGGRFSRAGETVTLPQVLILAIVASIKKGNNS